MGFLSQGDFLFPFDFILYWMKHFYTWSYQNGAVNMDGIIRLPSRFLNILVFSLSNNLMVGYFYIFFSMTLIFVSFYVFSGHFLDIKNRRTRIIGALFFAFNPIFLGYIAKIGLMVGVAMLPLCFVVLRQAFQKKQFRWFVLYILLLNISLIHPFTFTINLATSGLYILSMLKKGHGAFIWRAKAKALGVMLLGLALNAYFILPVAALGTVSKSAITEEISRTPVDYTLLVDFANTGDPFTALSLSRDVLLDFNYYNRLYEPIYFGAVFIFYLILLGLYVYNEKSLSKPDRERIVLLFGVFLLLLLLSMATFFDINTLLKMLVGLPGGWMFRSPLKWQLYIPLVLATMVSLLLHRTEIKRIRSAASTGSVVMLLLMSIFLGADIYAKLLVPRQFQHMEGLLAFDLKHKNLLFATDNQCFAFLQENPTVVTELNQILTSNSLQTKRIKSADLDTINLGSYDYVIGCKASLAQPLKQDARFRSAKVFAGNLELYQNQEPKPYIYATDDVFTVSKAQNLHDKYRFSAVRQKDFDFVTSADAPAATGLYDPFEAIGVNNIKEEKISTRVKLTRHGAKQLLLNEKDAPRYYKLEGERIIFSHKPLAGFLHLAAGQQMLDISAHDEWEFVYLDPGQSRKNLIRNPSFEEGLWQKDVWDCYAFDDKPAVGMRHNDKLAANGKKSLELTARRHIACTGPGSIPVQKNGRYLLNFQYQANVGSYGSYQVSFDDPNTTTVSDYLPANKGDWQEVNREIEIPADARNLRLTLNAHPSNSGAGGKMLYDNFTLVQIPDLQGRLYVVDEPREPLQVPKETSFENINPTHKRIHIKGATTGFYLAMRDTHHSQWRLQLHEKPKLLASGGRTVDSQDHLKLNGFMNGWYINPETLCQTKSTSCTRQNDGSYDIELTAEFAPQRWFYTGLIISGVAGLGVLGFFMYGTLNALRHGRNRYWRWQ